LSILIFLGPSLLRFDLDLNYGGISLYFDQLVQAKLLNLSLVTLTSNPSSTTAYSFTAGAYNNLTVQGNTTLVELFLHSDDYARLVLEAEIATSPDLTFISLGTGAIQSIYETPSVAINGLQVSNYLPDTSPPYVTKFLFSMDTGELILDFSEPVNISGFRLEGLAFQAKKNSLHEDQYVPLKDFPQQLASSNYQRRIISQVGTENLNSIKRIPRLCTQPENTFLSSWKPFVSDLRNNSVTIQSFQRIFGMNADQYTADSTSPLLLSWDLDLNRGQVTLHFSEPILMTLFNTSGVILCNGPSLDDSSTILRLSNTTILTYLNTEDPVLALSPEQFNLVKYDLNFCENASNTFLILEPFLAVDTSEAQNRYQGLDATVFHAQSVSNLTTDSTPPDLVSAKLDLTSRTLTLTFTEIIDVNSLSIREFVLQSSRTTTSATEVFQFGTPAPLLSSQDTDTIVFDLDGSFTQLKSFESLGRSVETTFVAYTYRFLRDQHGNNVIEIPTNRARGVDAFVPDFDSPSLTEWSIDMGLDRLILSFTEPINELTFNLSALVLQNQPLATRATVTQSLSLSSEVVRVGNDIEISLSTYDANQIKRHAILCAYSLSCFIYFEPSIGTDLGTVSMEGEILSNEIVLLPLGLAPASFTFDRIHPLLEKYDVDLSVGRVTLYFSEPISTRSIDFGGIHFYDGTVDFLAFSQNTIVNSPDPFTEVLELMMTRQNFYLLKKRPVFTVDRLRLTCTNETFFDYAGNFLNGELSGTSSNRVSGSQTFAMVQPTVCLPDKSRPTIVALEAVGYSSLTVYFDDVVSIESINKAKLFLSSFEAIKTLSLSSAAITTLETSSYKVDFSLSAIESQIRKNSPLLANQKNTYVYLGTSALLDSSTNLNSAMNPLLAIRKGGALLSFKLDMKDGILRFETVFPMDFTLSSVSANGFTLLNIDTNQNYLFSSFTSLTQSSSDSFFSLQMSTADLENIRQSGLVSKADSLRLTVLSSSIIDSTSNSLNATTTLKCVQLSPDWSPLSMSYYTLDMAKGYLDIFFTKHVVMADIDLSKLTLVNSRINPTNRINLRNASLDSSLLLLSASKWVRIDLNAGSTHPSVRDLIHLSKIISLSVSTYLVIDNGFAHDTSVPPNYLPEVIQDFAIQPQSITSDRTSPKLLSYDLDMKNRKLSLTFDEAVDAKSCKPSLLKLLASPDRPSTDIYWLSQGTAVSQETLSLLATAVIVLDLSSADVDNLMLQYPLLCSSTTNTYISYPTGAIRDIAISSNSLQKVFDIYAKQVSEFIPDTASPTILQFNLSIQSQVITFHFNEMVNCSATNINKISFQSTNFIGTLTERYSLHSSSSSLGGCDPSNPVTRYVTLHIGREDLLMIKTFSKLLKTALSTNLFLVKGAFLDIPGNEIRPLVDGHTLLVNSFVGDLDSPRLLSFSVTSQLNLILRFSEPMKLATLDLTKISFHNSRNPTVSYQLTRASRVVIVDSTLREITVYLHTDYDNMYTTTDIFMTQNSSFLSLSSDCASDTAGNAVEVIVPSSAMNMGPSVVDWDLDLNSGALTLFFSEQVSPNFSPQGIKIQTQDSSAEVILTTDTIVDPRLDEFLKPNSSFTVLLNNADMSRLKVTNFGQDPANIYLSAPAKLTRSVLPNTVVFPLNSTETLFPILVGQFTPDSTGPEVFSLVLDLDHGIFSMTFDEPVLGISFNEHKVSFRSSTRGISATLSESVYEMAINSSTLLINLTIGDLNALKASNFLSPLNEVLLEADFITDLFGNAPFRGADSVVSLTSLVDDVTPPALLSCSLDLSTNIFDLYFSEIIDLASLTPETIFLFANQSNPSEDNMTLSNFSWIESNPSQRESNVSINMALLRDDAFRLQANPSIGKETSATFLAVRNFRDFSGNTNSLFQMTQCLVLPDSQSPSLESFDFLQALGSVQLTLYFSEVIFLSAFNCSDFFLLSEPSASAEVFRPSDCTVITATDSREIVFSFPDPSFALIGSSELTTYLSVLSDATTDLSGNVISQLQKSDALRVGPQVTAYFLDMSSGSLTLIFSKDIDLSQPFNCSSIGFYSSSSLQTYRLSSSLLVPFFPSGDLLEFAVSLPFSSADLIQLKLLSLQQSSAFLLISSDGFYDSDLVSSPPISRSQSLLPTRFVDDTDPPLLLNVTLDLSSNLLLLLFDEPLEISSFQIDKFVLQSKAGSLSSSSISSYQLTTGTVTQQLNESFVAIQLFFSETDLTALKLDPSLATNASSSFLSIGYHGAQDIAGNSLPLIFPEDAWPVDHYIADTSSPSLLSFSLNMEIGEMKLHFSEPIDSGTVRPNEITLQSRYAQGATSALQLSDHSEVLSISGLVITVRISAEDIVSIKNTNNLARKASSTYLRAPSAMASDIAGNPMVPILDGLALPVAVFVPDSTRPQIWKIALDLSAEKLTILFSELVKTASVDISAITLHDSLHPLTSDSSSYTLQGSGSVSGDVLTSTPFSSLLEIQLSSTDLNALKARHPLASSAEFSFFSVQKFLCEDVYGNQVIPISSSSPVRVSSYEADVVPPQLLSYTLDMDLELLELQFSEVILLSSLHKTDGILQQTETKRYGSFVNLSSFVVLTTADSSLLTLQIARSTINEMKWNGIGISSSVSYLSWGDTFVSDANGNNIAPLWDASVLGLSLLLLSPLPLRAPLFSALLSNL
jgi:hypothetical protein